MKLPSFLATWASMITNPGSYWVLAKSGTKQIFGFFLISLALLSISSVLHWQFIATPEWRQTVDTTYQEVVAHYPADLTVTWDGQRVTSNTTQPQTIYYPSFINPEDWQLPKYFGSFIPLATNLESIPNSIKDTTWFLIGQEKAWISDQAGGWSEVGLSQALINQAPVTITAQSIATQAAVVRDDAQATVGLLSVIAWGVIPVIFILSGIWQAFLQSILVYFLLRFQQPNFPWRKAVRLAMFLTLVATLIEQLANWLYPSSTWPMFTITFWTVALLVFWAGRQRSW